MSARTKDAKGLDISTSVELPGSMTSYVMALPWGDTEYHMTLEASTDDVLLKYPMIGRNLRTLPYIHCKFEGGKAE